MAHQVISLHIKPHLAAYLTKTWRVNSEVINLTSEFIFGHYLFACIKSKSGKYKSSLNLGAVLKLRVFEHEKHGGSFDGRYLSLYINDVDAKRFNRAIELLMNKELFNLLDGVISQNPKAKIKIGILNFLDKYELEPQVMNYERCKQAYYRYKKSRERSKKQALIINSVKTSLILS